MKKLWLTLVFLLSWGATAYAQNPNPPGHSSTHVNHRKYKGGDLHEATTDGVTDGIVFWKNGTSQAIHNGKLGKWFPASWPAETLIVGDAVADGGLPPIQPKIPSLGYTTAQAAYMAGKMGGSPSPPPLDSTVVIDDYVFVTPAQVTKWGGLTSAINQVHLAEDAMNDALAHAGINARQRVVGISQYDQSGQTDNWNNDFNAFAIRVQQGNFNTQRAATGWDTITLMRSDGVRQGVCGTAYIFNSVYPLHVVDGDCATSNVSYGHECGHTFGLCHNYHETGCTPAAICGATGVGYGTGAFRTVMSYNGGPRTTQYSAPPPAVWWKDGISAVGIAGQTDATRCIKLTMATVAGWHATVIVVQPPEHTAPVLTLWTPVPHTAPTLLQWVTQ